MFENLVYMIYFQIPKAQCCDINSFLRKANYIDRSYMNSTDVWIFKSLFCSQILYIENKPVPSFQQSSWTSRPTLTLMYTTEREESTKFGFRFLEFFSDGT